jgi:hypothetical protein
LKTLVIKKIFFYKLRETKGVGKGGRIELMKAEKEEQAQWSILPENCGTDSNFSIPGSLAMAIYTHLIGSSIKFYK